MKNVLLSFVVIVLSLSTHAQTSIISTNSVAEDILTGNYNPSTYQASTVIDKAADIISGFQTRVSADSLKSLLEVLQTFENRNTASDTTSATRGIGAARRWVYNKFQQYSAENENRLIPSYLQFDLNICNVNQHRNIFAVLPGTDINSKSVVIIEGHIDSRCEDGCDTSCTAQGMEDNASGTALVMELARVMSKYSYEHTIVFLVTIGEEQGLHGARAFANYCKQKNIQIKGVLNNDVVGGIYCGQTASQPGCMGANSVDSVNLRIFSANGFNSSHKQLARFIKLEYQENILPTAGVPMSINIMTPVDRSGRGGDHIPFSDQDMTAIRFCAANEHGNADVSNPNYKDRQHTTSDVLGVDTDNDQKIDSFFVNFDYLSRMSIINANAASMMGIGPRTPDFEVSTNKNGVGLSVYITTEQQYQHYRVGVRSLTHDWDSVYTFTGKTSHYINLTDVGKSYFVSVASVDGEGVESLFSQEKMAKVGITDAKQKKQTVHLLQNHPNPFDGETYITVVADEELSNSEASIIVTDIAGKLIKRLNVQLHKGVNEVLYQHGYNVTGTYTYTLVVNGRKVESKRMVFAN